MGAKVNGNGDMQAAVGIGDVESEKEFRPPRSTPLPDKVDPTVISLVKKLDNPAPLYAPPEVPSPLLPSSINPSREEHGSGGSKKFPRFAVWLLLAGSLGGVSLVAVHGKAILAHVSTIAWKFVSETAEKYQVARPKKDQLSKPLPPAVQALNPSSNETDNHELVELRNETEWLRVRIDALNSDLSKQSAEVRAANEQIAELRGAKTKLQEEVTQLKEVRSADPHINVVEGPKRLGTRAGVGVPDTAAQTPPGISARPEARIASTSTSPTSSSSTPALQEYSVRRVVNGVAVIQDRSNSFEVSVGDDDPDIGKVQLITRQGTRWMVQTSKGIIGGR